MELRVSENGPRGERDQAGHWHTLLMMSSLSRVSTTPGNPGNLLEFVWSSWKFLCRMSMIDCIGFQSWWNWVLDHLFINKLIALSYLCHVLYCAYHAFVPNLGKLVDSVHCIVGRNNANMSWILLEIPPGISGNLLAICSLKFVDTLLSDHHREPEKRAWRCHWLFERAAVRCK